jgi:hypothetical protein
MPPEFPSDKRAFEISFANRCHCDDEFSPKSEETRKSQPLAFQVNLHPHCLDYTCRRQCRASKNKYEPL